MQFTTLAPTSRPGALRRPPLTDAPAVAAARPAPARPDPAALFDATTEVVREACVTRRFDHVVEAARTALPHCEAGSPRQTLMKLLAGATPAAPAAPGESRLWLLQRLDGSMVGLVRLRDDGEVAGARHTNESRWSLRGHHVVMCSPEGQPTTAFTLAGESEGRRVLLGLFMDSQTVHVLSEVDCLYSKLRQLDPELVGPFGGMLQAGQLQPALPAQPAVLLAAPRTGSHLLLNLLNSSGRVFFDAELMNLVTISIFGQNLKPEEAGALYSLRANDPVNFLKVMLSRSHHIDGRRLDDMAVRGFKLFPHQSHDAFDWVLAEPSLRIVHLYRENLLAEYSSLLVAYAEGHWVGGPASLKSRRIAFQPERFKRFVDTKRQYLDDVRGKLANRGGDVIEIEYSAFSRQTVNQVLAFLLKTPSDADLDALGLGRQLNERVIDRFDNPDDVKRCLAEIGQERWAGIEQPEVKGF
jgi:LPS sulfotransferase NodH